MIFLALLVFIRLILFSLTHRMLHSLFLNMWNIRVRVISVFGLDVDLWKFRIMIIVILLLFLSWLTRFSRLFLCMPHSLFMNRWNFWIWIIGISGFDVDLWETWIIIVLFRLARLSRLLILWMLHSFLIDNWIRILCFRLRFLLFLFRLRLGSFIRDFGCWFIL